MDTIVLKEFLIEELSKKIPADKIRDGATLRELVLADWNDPLVNKLIAEFCEMNPEVGAVLNPFGFKDAEQNALETVESLEYKMCVNHAGHAYQKKELGEIMQELDALLR
jgi:hypothetical protein